jgi:hypothetical protein
MPYDNYAATAYLTNSSNAAIAGTKYARAVEITVCYDGVMEGVSLNAQKLAGYTGVSFVLGMEDRNAVGGTTTFVVTADGKQVLQKLVRQGTFSTVVIPFGKAAVFNFAATVPSTGCDYLLLANPMAIGGAQPSAQQPAPQPAPSGGTPVLQLVSTTVSAGGQETALVTTAKNASVGIIIDYPDGSQVLVGPKRAGPDGHLVYTWQVPAGTHGTVHLVVDKGGAVAEGTFTVS